MSANTPASSQPSQPARPSRSATPASREDRVGQESKGFYAFAKLVVRLIIPLLARLRVVGLENVPASGPVILAQNHIAWVDIPLASLKVPRVSHYMAKIELFGLPVLGGIMRLLGAFPVRRRGRPRIAAHLRAAARAGEGSGHLPGGAPQRRPAHPGASRHVADRAPHGRADCPRGDFRHRKCLQAVPPASHGDLWQTVLPGDQRPTPHS